MQTLSANRNIHRSVKPVTRCAGNFKGQGKISPGASGADGFLNHSFLPLCVTAKKLPPQEETERGFYQSVEHLCKLHSINATEVCQFAYPYNVLLTHREIKTKLNRQPYETELLITREGKSKNIAVATKQVFEVGNELFYIPVIPLYRLLRKRENKASGTLLLAVMSYLYREAGIPYYRDEGGFMYDEYEMNKEYLECMNESPDDYEEDISDIIKNDLCGDIMQRKLYNRYHLDNFARTIEKFKPQNPFDEDCLLVAKEALELYTTFPKSNVFQHIEEPKDCDEVAIPESYVAFVGDCKGWVFETIERQINDYLGNYAELALPVSVQVFDDTATEKHTLEFEYRLFELIENLCNILYELP